MWQNAWFRWSVRVLALVLLALLAAVFFLRWFGQRELEHARKEFTEKVGPLDLTAYASKPVPEEENGAVWLRAGARAVVIFQPERAGLKSLAETPSSRWTQEQVESAKRLLERNAPALTLLHHTLGMKVGSVDDTNTDNVASGLQEVKAARLLAADSRDALRQGDMNRFFSSAEALRVLASAQERGTENLSLILGSYSERLLLPVIQEAACSPFLGKTSEERLDGLFSDESLMEAWRKSIGKMAADMEARMTAGTEEDYLGMHLSWMDRPREWTLGDLDHAGYLLLWARAIPWAREPYALRSPSPPAPPRMGPWQIIGSIAAPNLWSVAGRCQATMALRQMTLLGLQVRKAGLEKGAYPADLSAFPSAKIPDPFSGKPAAYALHPDGSATLAIPDAQALYNTLTAGKLPAIGFTWTLPPVSREADRRK